MRAAVGPDFGLMIDAHSWWRMGDRNYSKETVTELARSLSAYDPTWLEEPLPPEDHAGYRDLRVLKAVSIAAGEHEPDETGFLNLIRSGAADVIQMDVCCQGGCGWLSAFFQLSSSATKVAFHS
jgi:L-alanine-DL-glutamate epimerase-like enolase superfamily enzyme